MIDDQLVDKEGYWTAYYVNSHAGLEYQAGQTRGCPKTYDALLNPKWGDISLDTEAYGMFEDSKVFGAEESPRLF
jgi:hypothetical protein